ncbi:hypothetical protein [Streptomyces nojiriensis]|uniref:Secreted protein n=1 Tax=Streptomyces nojiriensis TaxID=66374 RepID=A0ABQ3SM99_9ACTN|nr:hypothetical protein [Streptomyces nojiriensis]QTI42838.1 hypothetical protein JYK04_00598 [Streptomyces nojiriensis]GGS17215.1 hypothetical protein GCM10010205_53960 [Streptomyces nojiriensis]GHI69260.1 hypothetical protein Snoj_31780 [Streptomyces nojiriensis]
MKLRHVRAVAVFGIAIFALTGARGSHGGSCGGGSHSSGSGSSGSSSSSGGSHGSDSTSGSTGSTGSSTSGSSVTGGSGNNKAERDIKIDACKMDASGKNLVAKITVTNSGSVDYTYNITMKFRGSATSAATPAQAKVAALTVKAGASKQAEATTAYTGKGDGSEYKECVVDSASKSAL